MNTNVPNTAENLNAILSPPVANAGFATPNAIDNNNDKVIIIVAPSIDKSPAAIGKSGLLILSI